MAGSDAGAVAKNGQKAEQFFPVTLGKRPTSLSGTKLATFPTQESGSAKANYEAWSLIQFYSVNFSKSRIGEKSAFSTNAQSGFASVVVDGVLGPPRLARHT